MHDFNYFGTFQHFFKNRVLRGTAQHKRPAHTEFGPRARDLPPGRYIRRHGNGGFAGLKRAPPILHLRPCGPALGSHRRRLPRRPRGWRGPGDRRMGRQPLCAATRGRGQLSSGVGCVGLWDNMRVGGCISAPPARTPPLQAENLHHEPGRVHI